MNAHTKAAHRGGLGRPGRLRWKTDRAAQRARAGGVDRCTFTQPTDVAHRAGSSYVYKTGVIGTIAINNATFGRDPIPNVPKAAYFKLATAAP
jgi:hypothetical protein